MSLRLNRSEPLFRTKIELPGIGRRSRSRERRSMTTKKLTIKFHGRTRERRSTTTKKLTIKFHGRTAKARPKFYI